MTMPPGDRVILVAGLVPDARPAQSAGLAFDNGVIVDPATPATSAPCIFTPGDRASFAGRRFRFIEPIHRQAAMLAAAMLEKESAGFEFRTIPVRLKSRSLPLTLALAA